MRSLDQVVGKINRSTYKLDTSGVVGLLGGQEAVDALETIHLYAGRRWAGWYNYPGSATVAKKFGQIANHSLWDTIFPGPNSTPALTFRLAGKPGPGYSGYLIAEECAASQSTPLELKGRVTGSAADVTVIRLPPHQHERIMMATGGGHPDQKHQFIPICPPNDTLVWWAIVPSLISIGACVVSALASDPLCASLIFFGIVSSGFSSWVLGAAKLRIRVPVPSPGSPSGEGLMFPESGSVIVLKGKEADVNIVTKGEFELVYPKWIQFGDGYHAIGLSSLLLMAQFIVQLLLIPRCTLFGQLLFLLSLLVSGVYHLYVVSRQREIIQRKLLSQTLSIHMDKWTLGTRTQMAVFVCLVLADGLQDPHKLNSDAILNRIIPNDTTVWGYWRRKVLKELERFWNWNPQLSGPYQPSIEAAPDSEDKTGQ
ncbi:hypothetical protein JVU11DRAFT_8469 [Chiua virens]|nr:hypothetical protein JVU11DRAFT_8469 [Chiua virens]